MSIYQTKDYRAAIRGLIESRKRRGDSITFARICEKAGIQTTYFSNVLKERAHFSSDQVFAIGNYLKLDKGQVNYLLLLLEWSKSGHPVRKKSLEDQIAKIQKEYLRPEEHINANILKNRTEHLADYYLDPYMQVIHIMLDLDDPPDFNKLAKNLGISLAKVNEIVSKLEMIGYVREENSRFVVKKKNFFLSKDSNLHGPHLSLLRLRSVEHMLKLNNESKQAISVTFSADEETFQKIQSEFMKFFSKCEKLVKKAPSVHPYQLNFDLFPWQM